MSTNELQPIRQKMKTKEQIRNELGRKSCGVTENKKGQNNVINH